MITLYRELPENKRRENTVDHPSKVYEYDAIICPANRGGAYLPFPYDVRAEFGRGRVKVYAAFDGEPYEGSVVNMGMKHADGSVCYIIGIRKMCIRDRLPTVFYD